LLQAGVQRAALLSLARRSAAELVDRRARHAPRNSRACPAPSGEPEAPPAAADPLVVGIAAAGADDPDRGDLQRAGDRIVRNDRGRAPDGVEPAAAARAQTRLRRARCWASDRAPGPGLK